MKWKREYRRIIKRFAFLPIAIGDDFVWLETTYIRQKFCQGIWSSWWEDIEFVTKEEYKEYKKGKKTNEKEFKNSYIQRHWKLNW